MADYKDLDTKGLREAILKDDPNRGDLAPGTSVEEMSVDSVTGLLNRGLWMSQTKQYVKEAIRKKATFAIVMMDLDDFKQNQDKEGHGHRWGDAKLEEFGMAIRKKFRDEDIKGRYGGDEAIVLMEDLEIPEAELKNKAREISDFLELKIKNGVSVGIARWDGQESLGEIIKRADMNLYKVKGLKNSKT